MKTLKEFLDSEDLLSPAKLAAKMYPGVVSPRTRFSQKLKEVKSGNSIQRITESDEKKAKDIIRGLGERCIRYADGKD